MSLLLFVFNSYFFPSELARSATLTISELGFLVFGCLSAAAAAASPDGVESKGVVDKKHGPARRTAAVRAARADTRYIVAFNIVY